jgi:hypothetical protein
LKEADVQTIFRNINNEFGIFELKLLKADDKGKVPPLAFNRLAAHQKESLLAVSSDPKGFFHKLTDPAIYSNMGTRFNQPRPWDCQRLAFQPAYVVVAIWINRVALEFFYIPIQTFVEEEATSVRKSMTPERIVELAVHRVAQNGRQYYTGEAPVKKEDSVGRLF